MPVLSNNTPSLSNFIVSYPGIGMLSEHVETKHTK